MNWLWVAVGSQIILGTSAVFDKVLLKRKFFSPAPYAFWLGILGLAAVFLMPFGFALISYPLALKAFVSGAFLVAGMFFLFWALEKSEASEIIPAVGGLSPVLTLALAYVFLGSVVSPVDFAGFALLVFGGLVFLSLERKVVRRTIIALVGASILFFALSNVAAKAVYLETSFINGFIWIKFGGAMFSFLLLIFPAGRKRISFSLRRIETKSKWLYLSNRAYVAAGSLLFGYAISLTHPALVDATNSFRYAVVFLAGWLLLKERFRGKILLRKIIAVALVMLGLIWLSFAQYLQSPAQTPKNFGATFSYPYAEKFGLNWQAAYLAVIDDLGVKNLRIPVYWNEVEKEEGIYDFSAVDWQINEAEKRGAKIILAVGRKLPRWPECHIPSWAREIPNSKSQIPKTASNQALLKYLEAAINRYKNNPAIWAWQVENEPFLTFGECPDYDRKFLDEEIELVRLMSSKPIIITDSGEFGLWVRAAKRADIFGTTMYRTVWNEKVGYFTYPLSPGFFKIKRLLMEFFVGKKPMMVIELQAEPWGPRMAYQAPLEEQFASMNPEKFKETLSYIEHTGFDTFYFWGVEWWYWLKQNGQPEIWETVKEFIKDTNILMGANDTNGYE